jgi:hypothetical protein
MSQSCDARQRAVLSAPLRPRPLARRAVSPGGGVASPSGTIAQKAERAGSRGHTNNHGPSHGDYGPAAARRTGDAIRACAPAAPRLATALHSDSRLRGLVDSNVRLRDAMERYGEGAPRAPRPPTLNTSSDPIVASSQYRSRSRREGESLGTYQEQKMSSDD